MGLRYHWKAKQIYGSDDPIIVGSEFSCRAAAKRDRDFRIDSRPISRHASQWCRIDAQTAALSRPPASSHGTAAIPIRAAID
jgi:hypothetical protein